MANARDRRRKAAAESRVQQTAIKQKVVERSPKTEPIADQCGLVGPTIECQTHQEVIDILKINIDSLSKQLCLLTTSLRGYVAS